MRNHLDGVYYILYSLNIKWFGENDIPHFNTVCWFSIVQFFWVINTHIVLTVHTGIEFKMPPKAVIVLLAISIGIINGFFFLKGRRYLSIKKKFDEYTKSDLKRFKVLATVFPIMTLGATIVLMVLFLGPE